ncbi:MAG: cytochrome C [Bryobacteraceae bacterium]
MRSSFKDALHLIRLAVVLVIAFAAFFVLRSALVPKTFGQYGHYRGAALAEVRANTASYAGHAACEPCHEEIVTNKKVGRHAGVACEACHGPLAKHADDPSAKPQLPDTAVLCARCHEANSARPRRFPQVVLEEHSGGEPCGSCHQPHQPKIGG